MLAYHILELKCNFTSLVERAIVEAARIQAMGGNEIVVHYIPQTSLYDVDTR